MRKNFFSFLTVLVLIVYKATGDGLVRDDVESEDTVLTQEDFEQDNAGRGRGITRNELVRQYSAGDTDTVLTQEDFDHAHEVDDSILDSLGIRKINPTLGRNFEGDIKGFNDNSIRRMYASINHSDVHQSMLRDAQKKWPRGEVPYVISSRYSTNARRLVAKAIDDFHRKTCIKFVPRTQQTDYVNIFPDQGCYALVGRQGGRQPLSLADGCLQHGTIIHEMLHTLGFYHEQSRTDRDRYVDILWDNIEQNMWRQFQSYPKEEIDDLGFSYDYGSVMHYGDKDFSKNAGEAIGQRIGFSERDLDKLKRFYCGGSPPRPPTGPSPVTQPPVPQVYTMFPTPSFPQFSTLFPFPTPAFPQIGNQCTDRMLFCNVRVNNGDCVNNRLFMMMNCQKSCGMCSDNGPFPFPSITGNNGQTVVCTSQNGVQTCNTYGNGRTTLCNNINGVSSCTSYSS